MQNTRTVVVPDLNHNEWIESVTGTAGAYTGAAVTAVAGGLLTAISAFGRFAFAGAKVTHLNAGDHQIPVENRSPVQQQPQIAAPQPIPGYHVIGLAQPVHQPQPQMQISEEEMALIIRHRQSAAATNGN